MKRKEIKALNYAIDLIESDQYVNIEATLHNKKRINHNLMNKFQSFYDCDLQFQSWYVERNYSHYTDKDLKTWYEQKELSKQEKLNALTFFMVLKGRI